ncbi:phage integrase N-terminal SAM-like domain-containing protein [Dokdonella sp. MW10]|uniref:phage integrase N-terminal SAM-like domain-containing protein n=1 Tax=Dokdonella sp. MW10 TaxID=2992926 RepID=UPI003F7D2B37
MAADAAGETRLFDKVRRRMRLKRHSLRTEVVYSGWMRRAIIANERRHHLEMASVEVEVFLSAPAVEGNVAASTQI